MHPLLRHWRRLLAYLLAWLPIAGLMTLLLATSGRIAWPDALALALPLCACYAFICLSAWYGCLYLPPGSSPLPRLVAVSALEALFAAGVWTVAARLLARGLRHFAPWQSLNERPALPLVLVAGVLLYLLAIGMFYALLAVESARAAEARLMQAGLLAREAELKALKAQLHPHFLFNSLNSISALTSSDPARAREMCIRLGDFLRRTLGLGEKTAIPLAEELSLIAAFLDIESVRFGERLRLEQGVDPAVLDALVPPLLLQPLVENAVVHGVANLVEGGWIRLSAAVHGPGLRLSVANRYDPEAPRRRPGGVGLSNVRARLLARYDNRAALDVVRGADAFTVTLTLPREEPRP